MKFRTLNFRERSASSSGFTLIEVMVVTIIVSVIVAAILFSVDITSTQKTRAVVSDLRLLMQGLSNEAILEGHHYGIKWERAAQKFVPVFESGSGWVPYSTLAGERPNFKQVSWKGVAEIAMTLGVVTFDERIKDDEGLGLQREEQTVPPGPVVEFWPTGLWQPAGKIEFFVGKKPYATLAWTAAGRMRLEQGRSQ